MRAMYRYMRVCECVCAYVLSVSYMDRIQTANSYTEAKDIKPSTTTTSTTTPGRLQPRRQEVYDHNTRTSTATTPAARTSTIKRTPTPSS